MKGQDTEWVANVDTEVPRVTAVLVFENKTKSSDKVFSHQQKGSEGQ
jgi:hypothetical protein